jgi:hypothetical protein
VRDCPNCLQRGVDHGTEDPAKSCRRCLANPRLVHPDNGLDLRLDGSDPKHFSLQALRKRTKLTTSEAYKNHEVAPMEVDRLNENQRRVNDLLEAHSEQLIATVVKNGAPPLRHCMRDSWIGQVLRDT